MILINERAEAEKLLNQSTNLIKLGDLMLLAKYFDNANMNIYNNLKNYINARVEEYNQVIYDDYIEKSIKHSESFKLREVNRIFITQKELEHILKITDFKTQKVMFTILMVSKYYRANKSNKNDKKDSDELYFSNSISDIFKLAKVPYSLKENIRITRELSTMGYVEWFIKGTAKILIADLGGEPLQYFVPNDDMVYYIYRFNNFKVIECEHCGKWAKTNKMANNIKYCSECSATINRNKTKDRMNNLRKNSE